MSESRPPPFYVLRDPQLFVQSDPQLFVQRDPRLFAQRDPLQLFVQSMSTFTQGWGSTWGPNSSAQMMAPHVPASNQGDTPLAPREAAARSAVVNSVLAGSTMHSMSVTVDTPTSRTIAITLDSAVAVKATATATLTTAETDGPTPRIARAPAGRLTAVLGFIFTGPAYERIIAPYIAQEQHEYYDALLQRSYGRAKYIVWRMRLMAILLSIRPLVAALVRLFTGGR